MKRKILFAAIFQFLILSCSQPAEKHSTDSHEAYPPAAESSNNYNDLFFDSTQLEQFINTEDISEKAADLMRNFYHSREFQYAWFDRDGLTEQAKEFWDLHKNYVDLVQDSTLHDRWLHKKMASITQDAGIPDLNDPEVLKTELALTDHFFRYAKSAYTGSIDPKELGWYIPRKKIDPVQLLDSLIEHRGREIDAWAPVNPQYSLMKKQLLHYYDMEKAGGWPAVSTDRKLLRQGDSSSAVVAIKKRLEITGDLAHNDGSPDFDISLEDAVMHFQKRMGLNGDGVVGPATLSEMNVPVKKRIEKILINMERMRWLPQQPSGNYILVNIPEFVLRVFENNQQINKMKVVVGKQGHNTQIFSDKIEYVVLSPYWNVPQSIVKSEILPAMEKDPGYLDAHNMEIVKHQNGIPVIRQKPGPGNALGQVKFLFPNNFNIYLHDTPAQSLFDQDKRAFSHGCIRISDPLWMAEWLLRNQDEWTDSRIIDAMNSDKEKWVKLKDKMPVLITYFTVWVTEDGEVNFRKDIYGHDKRVAAKLFK